MCPFSHPNSCFTDKPAFQRLKSHLLNKPLGNCVSNLLKLNRKLILSTVRTNGDINVNIYIIKVEYTMLLNLFLLRVTM